MSIYELLSLTLKGHRGPSIVPIKVKLCRKY